MLKWIVLITGLFASSFVYSQGRIDFDSIQKILRKTNKRDLRVFKSSGDSSFISFIVVTYKKSTYELLGVQISVKKGLTDASYPRLSQYAFYFMQDDAVLLKVFAEHSDGKHAARAQYLFKGYQLVSKEENMYVEQDYSNLIARCEFFKQMATQRIKEKFSK